MKLFRQGISNRLPVSFRPHISRFPKRCQVMAYDFLCCHQQFLNFFYMETIRLLYEMTGNTEAVFLPQYSTDALHRNDALRIGCCELMMFHNTWSESSRLSLK